MAREYQEPKTHYQDGPVGGTISNHPAFGQIAVSRCSGGRTSLYGSDFVHNSYLTVRISTSELRRDLSCDWHFAKDEFIEVALSEAQWATFVSSPNMGSGVPCTIQRREGQMVPGIMPIVDRHEQFQFEAQERLDNGIKQLDDMITMIDSMGMPVKKANELKAKAQAAKRELGANIGFVADSFAEHMEDVTEKAKAEVHGYVNGVIHRAGISAISGDPIALLSGKDANNA